MPDEGGRGTGRFVAATGGDPPAIRPAPASRVQYAPPTPKAEVSFGAFGCGPVGGLGRFGAFGLPVVAGGFVIVAGQGSFGGAGAMVRWPAVAVSH